jgi:hypothetical protein
MDYCTPLETHARTIVLFHFHAHFELCRPRIELLRRFNPGVEIFGLYGGESARVDEARRLERSGVNHVFENEGRSPAWNKKNTDLAVAGWYRSVGRTLPFGRVHVVQWDLLFFAPLDRMYPSLSPEAVALTGLVPLEAIAHFWDWTANAPLSIESERLLSQTRERFGFTGGSYACIGPGYSLSRRFLELYSQLEIDDTGHDELRLPLFAQILGFELADTGFYPRWMDPKVERVFNADAQEVDPAVVESELVRPEGRRVFHPCRDHFDELTIARLVSELSGHQT